MKARIYLSVGILFLCLALIMCFWPWEEVETTGPIEDKYTHQRGFGGTDYYVVIDGEEYEVNREEYHTHEVGDNFTHVTDRRGGLQMLSCLAWAGFGSSLLIYSIERPMEDS